MSVTPRAVSDSTRLDTTPAAGLTAGELEVVVVSILGAAAVVADMVCLSGVRERRFVSA